MKKTSFPENKDVSINSKKTFNYYPPAEVGLRGNASGTFTNAHRLMVGKKPFNIPTKDHIDEQYDLVIVGAGISGLAAAKFYREKHPDDTVLILDNSDDFGGHCGRTEFTTSKGLLITYAGSESLQSPRAVYSDIATDFIKSLAVDLDVLETNFNVDFYPNLGLSKAVYFDKKNWGENKIVVGDPQHNIGDDIPKDKLNGRSYAEFIGDFPINDADKKMLIKFSEKPIDYLTQFTIKEKIKYLEKNSYRDFLRDHVNLSERLIKYFSNQTTEFYGIGIDAISCMNARACGLLGFDAMGLPPLDADSQAELDDLYIHHFPDGNASIARLIVRSLIPEVASGKDMNDIVLAKFDYQKLDQKKSKTKIRLHSTVIFAENIEAGADVVYFLNDEPYRIRAKNVIMANYNSMIPYMVPSMPKVQKEALAQNIRTPFVYGKVVIKNWHIFKRLGIHRIYSPTAPFSLVKLDYPVSMGGYEHSQSPNEPICLHMVHVPIPSDGSNQREQSRAGRKKILHLELADFENMINEQLDGMFGEYGFDHKDMVISLTVNRWGHGYSYFFNSLFDDEEIMQEIIATARQPFGNIFIANSDSEWSAYMHSAIDAAYRAVSEIDERHRK